jgi:hypothetical protein
MMLDKEILSINIAAFAQPLAKRCEIGVCVGTTVEERAQTRDLDQLLRVGGRAERKEHSG